VPGDGPERSGESAVDRVRRLGIVDCADEPVPDCALGVAL